MRKQIVENKFFAAAVICLVVTLLSSSDASAWDGRYHYRGGKWHRSGWFWAGAGVTALTVGAIVASLPPRREVVYVGGSPYYYYDNYYYRPCPRGYVVVPQPVIVEPAPQPVFVAPAAPQPMPAPVTQESFTVNIPNSRGGYTAVTLKRSGNGFIGPQGEYYADFPSVEQLRTMYGK